MSSSPSSDVTRGLTSYFSLATETEYVRSRLAAYANDLLSLGVDGLRLDAIHRGLLRRLRTPSLGEDADGA